MTVFQASLPPSNEGLVSTPSVPDSVDASGRFSASNLEGESEEPRAFEDRLATSDMPMSGGWVIVDG